MARIGWPVVLEGVCVCRGVRVRVGGGGNVHTETGVQLLCMVAGT